jgi:DNA primase
MRFPPQFLDELRARLPVSEVVGRRVKLKRTGREFTGLSPFNQEKTPSFTVNDAKGFFHDFSSGRHGDIFAFVMETEGVDFPEAVERLASLAGIPVPKVSEEAEAREERRRTLHDVLELAAKFFEATLAARNGAKARGYLADRGLEPATQLRFRLGYAAPDRFALKEHLGAQGIPVEDMVEAGLLIAGDDIPLPFDRFRDRVMFPITDLRGRIIAFGGRALAKDAQAKYLNSPETPLFHKGANLYNGANARLAAHKGAPVVAVEGYVDVIAMVRAGYEATVAPLGTALTEDQLGLLWKMADEPLLCFDGDKAGRRAAYRAIELALPQLKPGKSLRFAALPEGQDPDDLCRSGGREAVDAVLSAARPLADMLWLRETEAGGFDTPERRAALEARIEAATAAIGDQAVRKYYRQDLGERLRRLFAPGDGGPRRSGPDRRGPDRRSWRQGRSGPQRPGSGPRGDDTPIVSGQPYVVISPHLATSALHRPPRTALPQREALIILAVVNHPWLLATHAEEFAELDLRHPDAERLRGAILDCSASHPDGAELRSLIAAQDLAPVLARVESAMTHRCDWEIAAEAAAEDVGRWWSHVVTLHRKARTLNRELKEAEQALGAEPSEANLAWLRDVKERLAAVEGNEAQIEGFGASSGRAVRSL